MIDLKQHYMTRIIEVQKYLPIISILLLFVTLGSLWLSPTISPTLGAITLLLSLALSTYAIVQKHKGTEHARAKILKEVGVMVITLIVIIFLGGIAAMLANYQVGMRWGEVVSTGSTQRAGLISAIVASFGVGYLVRAGMGRFAR